MITVSDLTADELAYLRSKWGSEETELQREKSRKMNRLNDRLNRTAEDAIALSELETDLQEMQGVLSDLQAGSGSATSIARIQTQVDALEAQVNGFGTSTTHVSNTDAMLYQLELDELDALRTLRVDKIAEIDAQLGT